MSAKHAYLLLCIVGFVAPYSRFVPWALDHGLDAPLFVEQMFANPIAAFFAADVIVSSLALWVLVAVEGRRARVPHRWAPIVASLLVGVSLGLPLFLYLRERAAVPLGTRRS